MLGHRLDRGVGVVTEKRQVGVTFGSHLGELVLCFS
jgi:hypothetical protein